MEIWLPTNEAQVHNGGISGKLSNFEQMVLVPGSVNQEVYFKNISKCVNNKPGKSRTQHESKNYLSSLTRDFSSSLVIMTTVAALCSHTILQKSPKVSGKGPWVAM